MPIKIYKISLLFVFGVYLFSLSQNAILFERHDPVNGLGVLGIGWLGPLLGSIAWYANLLFLISVLLNLAKKPYISLAVSFLSVLVALTSPYARNWAFDEGASTKIMGLGPAYETWLAGLSLHFALTLFLFIAWAAKYKGPSKELER